jgi:hypothetical protein
LEIREENNKPFKTFAVQIVQSGYRKNLEVDVVTNSNRRGLMELDLLEQVLGAVCDMLAGGHGAR